MKKKYIGYIYSTLWNVLYITENNLYAIQHF